MLFYYYLFLLVILKHTSVVAVLFDNVEYKRVKRQNLSDPCITSNNQTGKCTFQDECTLSKTDHQILQNCEGDDLVCCPTNIKMNDFSQCGISNRFEEPQIGTGDSGIINGKNAKLGNWAWIAALYYTSDSEPEPKSMCGGSLISKNWVVTAAHCIDNTFKLTKVRLGDLNLNDSIDDGATPIDVPVGEVIVHPKFRAKPLTNDIALIRLNHSVTFTEHIHAICVASGQDEVYRNNDYYYEKSTYVVGYGKHGDFSELSTALQEAEVQIVYVEECARNYLGYNAVIGERVLCAGGFGRDSCQGSSGGPLALLSDAGVWYLIGVVSFGVGCGDPYYPGVYTKVPIYSDWISNVTGLHV